MSARHAFHAFQTWRKGLGAARPSRWSGWQPQHRPSARLSSCLVLWPVEYGPGFLDAHPCAEKPCCRRHGRGYKLFCTLNPTHFATLGARTSGPTRGHDHVQVS
ncbi:hypothetical protein CC85DRAFT_135513 [Cutaneotrichosporon oleaginosum]|uniref:Uncharacterized protein n=1 Tax=Cutaneotrichosporon oleaginosum TaxID=879819 RepID=A0A0J0XWN0_9TREE|nr:uncharacterized protein CC85DRAFT_135513 [Cutaneotrichosporon oleaginosum]KLT45475.1 hypothetical protein CC85DRAFT_135513 [Cutaneotrichosporon oleaginosum]TXT14569.1 hypothetical protein COLE_00762 [Cutaneotrichosporon oleaginosum]